MNKSFLFVMMIISTSFTGCLQAGDESDFTEQIKNLEDKIEALEKEIENLESEKSNETIEDLELEIENLESEKSNETQLLGVSGVAACIQGLMIADNAGFDIGNSVYVVLGDANSMNKTVEFGLESGDDAATICAKVGQSKYGMIFSGWNSMAGVESGISFMEEGNYASTSIDFDERALLGSWRSPMKLSLIHI